MGSNPIPSALEQYEQGGKAAPHGLGEVARVVRERPRPTSRICAGSTLTRTNEDVIYGWRNSCVD